MRQSLSSLKGKAPPSHRSLDQLEVRKKLRDFFKMDVTNILSSDHSRKNPSTRGASNGQGESLITLLSRAGNSDTDKPSLTQRLAENVLV